LATCYNLEFRWIRALHSSSLLIDWEKFLNLNITVIDTIQVLQIGHII